MKKTTTAIRSKTATTTTLEEVVQRVHPMTSATPRQLCGLSPHPDQIGISRDLLAHADFRMQKYYNRAKGIEASRVHNELIAHLKGKARRNSRH